MRNPKSTTALGRTLEERVAKDYSGQRSRSSGAAAGRKGDVSYDLPVTGPRGTNYHSYLAECKTTEAQSISLKRSVWDKIEQEAMEQSRRPCMFLRFFDRDTGRHLDLVVRNVDDDLEMIE